MIFGKRWPIYLISLQLAAGCTPDQKKPEAPTQEVVGREDEKEDAVMCGPPTFTDSEIAEFRRAAQAGDVEAKRAATVFSNYWVPECARNEYFDCNKSKRFRNSKEIKEYQSYLIDLMKIDHIESTCHYVDILISSDIPTKMNPFLSERKGYFFQNCPDKIRLSGERKRAERFFERSELR